MRPVKVITDSCSDLTPELMEKYNIDYAQMNTVFEGKTTPADLAWTREQAHAFYDLIRAGNRVTTTQVPVEEFQRVFRKYLDEGYDIVYVGCSSKQSGSVNTAEVLSRKLREVYPDASVYSVDSLHASTGEGVLAIEAAKAAAEGKTAAEVASFVKERRKYLNQFVTVHSLDALKRAGRVKASSAFFGNLMGVKPILIADADGEQTAVKKAKGRAGSFREIVALLKDTMTSPEEQTVYFSHSDCSDEEVETLKKMVLEETGCKDVYVGLIGPIIGASIGPDAVALFGFGREITYRVSEH
ncbi:MAG: DegV family protein [Clostridia bacterium]|nr:DegV family protein [Clostridia bacterium]